jgi:sec-independent protein translocase protein TatC
VTPTPVAPEPAAQADRLSQAWQDVTSWLMSPAPFSQAPWAVWLGLLLGALVLVIGGTWLALPWARRWWTDETSAPDEDERGVSTVEMTLQEHLAELRSRLIISVIALAVTTGIAFIFYRTWFEIAIRPIVGRGNCAAVQDPVVATAQNVPIPNCLQAITPTELVFAFFQLALVVGLIVAMPILAYQAWAYIAPGLTRKERRYVIAIVPGATISFIVGVLFAYFALMPAALGFLFAFGSDLVEIRPTVATYISFISRLLIAIGVIFQLPLAMFFLSKVHLINPRMLGGIRRYVVVVAFIVSAVVTPTPDPLNQLLVAIPILVLYEVGVLLARVAA